MKACVPSFVTKNCYYLFLGITLILSGVISIFLWPTLFDAILNRELVLKPNSRTYNIWEKSPVPIYMDFYFFNWTNADEVNNKSVKPMFDEVGPYRFRETKRKVATKWNDHNSTISYRIEKRWYFLPKESSGSLDDSVVTLNTVARTVAYQAKDWSYLVKKGISMAIGNNGMEIYVKKTVGQLLFDGYEDFFITLGKKLPFLAGVEIPDVDRFGWFYGRNGSANFEGQFNVATGKDSKDILGKLLRWNYRNETGYFPGKCGRVHGSAGDFFPQNLQKDILKMFSADLCRTMLLDYDSEVQVEGITGYKYVAGPSLMDNGTKVPGNKCFCPGLCQPSGMLNVSVCRYGSPAFVSLPHYLEADPYYINLVEGLKPQKDKHQFFIALEPRTGIPLQVAARLQLNILLEPDSEINIYSEAPYIYFPVLWFEQSVKMSPDMAQSVKQLLNLTMIGRATSGVVLIIGVFLLIFVALVPIKTVCSNLFSTKKQLFTKEEIPLNEKEQYESNCIVVDDLRPKKVRSMF